MESGENPELSRNCNEYFSKSDLYLYISMLSRLKAISYNQKCIAME